mgnify:CR=1 FL=1
MIVVIKGFFLEFDIGISTDSNFESRQFQTISATFSDFGLRLLGKANYMRGYDGYLEAASSGASLFDATSSLSLLDNSSSTSSNSLSISVSM